MPAGNVEYITMKQKTGATTAPAIIDLPHSPSVLQEDGVTAKRWVWSKGSVPNGDTRTLLFVLEKEYPLTEASLQSKDVNLSVMLNSHAPLRITVDSGHAVVEAPELSQIARGIGVLLSGQPGDHGKLVANTTFKTRGVLLDCSRCAVMKPAYIKQWLTRLAMFGFNTAMLYTKDTYRLPDEEYFGYLRGAYSEEEIRQVDDHAAALGIELVPCIQALGHLEPVLRWPAYSNVRDTISVLRVDKEETYTLVAKMLDFWSGTLRSKRIHLGMDESFGLGRGRFMDANGFRRGFELFTEHLNKVVALCRQRDLSPIIWSDMYFRMASKTMEYYDTKSVVSSEIAAAIPSEVQLCYWDYCHENETHYIDWLRRHKNLASKPLMASGIWTWPQLWYNHEKTAATITPCISVCVQEHVDEIIFTTWGDDGGYCDWSSAWAGACYAAERLFNDNIEPDAALMEKRFSAICHGSFRDHRIASEISEVAETETLSASAVLWDDPLLGIYWKERHAMNPTFWADALNRYRQIIRRLDGRPRGQGGDIKHVALIAQLLELKITISLELHEAYSQKNHSRLQHLQKRIPEVLRLYDNLLISFRRQWYERCKTFGFEVIQHRMAATKERYRELNMRLAEFLKGQIESIPELDETITHPKGLSSLHYDSLATAYVNSVTTL